MLTRSSEVAGALVAVAALTCVLTPGAVQAQGRPTLAEAESRIGVLESELAALEAEHAASEASACAAADTNGDSYRPLFCDPSCTCGIPTASAGACTETTAGTFSIETSPTPFNPTCQGVCFLVTAVDGGGSWSDLAGTTDLCSVDSDCLSLGGPFPSLNFCAFTDPFDPATAIGACVELGQSPLCESDADCPTGYTCGPAGTLAAGYCTSTCTSASDTCPAGSLPPAVIGTLVGVTTPTDLAPVQCTVDVGTSLINNVDAAQCIADVEATLGSSCSYLCGNGALDPGEQCDDGNTSPGDGCDASCQLE